LEKWVRFSLDPTVAPTTPDRAADIRYGVLEGDAIREAPGLGVPERGREHRLAEVRLLPPCSPSKIVCVGRNYMDHAKELNNPVPEEPLIFLKPPSALIGHGDAIVLPEASSLVHFEGELGLVIGRRARRVSRSEALEYVFGYTCINDVTARDIQKKENKFTRAKGFDTFCAVGPWVAPRGQVDAAGLRIRTTVDGVIRQEAPVTEMIFPVDAILEFISGVMTLEPGDLIATGTPAGVGALEPGAEVTVEVIPVGALTNPVAAEGGGAS
jgi:2-keto-4-pentenoate hydratase/2-oxohepta-3-ene-1,7-dioic acid hydratase in catechol pathway